MTTRKMMTVAVLAGCLGLTVRAETPDFLADTLRSDGVGYIDTGYRFKASSPKTSRVVFKYETYDYAKGTTPGPVVTDNQRNLFGYQGTAAGDRYIVRYNGNNGQVVYQNGNQYVRSGQNGDLNLVADLQNAMFTWGETVLTEVASPTVDSEIPCYLFSENYRNTSPDSTCVIDFKQMTVYEMNEQAVESVALDLRPCVKNGIPAVYNAVSQTVLYPIGSTNGFVVSGYDITTVAGRQLVINEKDNQPRTLALVAGSELVFDGRATLAVPNGVTLPATGSVKISMASLNGEGRYVLMDGLPTDFDLDAFSVGTMPLGNAGVLSKDGAKLVLTASGNAVLPDAIADTLRSDGVGYIDTGYRFKVSFPKTSRVVFKYETHDYAKGTAPGPVVTDSQRYLFGYQGAAAGDKYFVLYHTDNGQVVYPNGNQYVRSGQNGDLSLVADLLNAKFTWGETVLTDVACPAVDSNVPCYLFSENWRNTAPDSTCVIDFKRMTVYEKGAQGVELKALDLRPCVQNGTPAVYDAVSQTVLYPIDSTNGFVASGVKWRLTANGEVSFMSGSVTVASTETSPAAGWIVLRDADGVVVARGAGSVAEFTMPEAAVTLRWTHDIVKDGDVRLSEDLFANRLTVLSGSALTFVGNAAVYLAQGLSIDGDGTVAISAEGLAAAGTYALVDGLDATVELSRFAVGAVPDGFAGALEFHGNRLVLRLTGCSPVVAAQPDALADVLRSDGVGYVNLGYCYKMSSYPKTKRLLLDFNTTTYGLPPGDEKWTVHFFGSMNFYARFNGGNKGEVLYYNGTKEQNWTTADLVGDNLIQVDFIDKTGSWGSTALEAVVPPEADDPYPWYVFDYDYKNSAKGPPSIVDFRRLEIYEIDERESEFQAHKFVPCVKDGKVGLYDTVAKSYAYPEKDAGGFVVTGMKWPAGEYALMKQDCSRVTTESYRPVEEVSADEYVFVADGKVCLRNPADSLTIERYAPNGSLASSETWENVAAGISRVVSLDGAVKAVVRVTGAVPTETIVQSFDVAETIGTSVVEMRQMAKRQFEFQATADVTFKLKVDIAEACVDRYDAQGKLIGTEKVAGALLAGQSFAVTAGTATKIVVRVKLRAPGLVLTVK